MAAGRREILTALCAVQLLAAGAAFGTDTAARLDQLNEREKQLIQKLESVRERERYLENQLEDLRRRKDALLNKGAVVAPGARAPTPDGAPTPAP